MCTKHGDKIFLILFLGEIFLILNLYCFLNNIADFFVKLGASSYIDFSLHVLPLEGLQSLQRIDSTDFFFFGV